MITKRKKKKAISTLPTSYRTGPLLKLRISGHKLIFQGGLIENSKISDEVICKVEHLIAYISKSNVK